MENYHDIENCRAECHVEGGDLASIHDEQENKFIQTLQKDKAVWLGGYISEKGGKFMWSDGSDWDFHYWGPGYPVLIFLFHDLSFV